MRQFAFFLIALFCLASLSMYAQTVQVTGLSCEYRTNPVGIDILKPRLSWQVTSSQRNVMQSAYELRVGTESGALGKGKQVLWQTGKVASDQSMHVTYEGPALKPKQRCYWQVGAWFIRSPD